VIEGTFRTAAFDGRKVSLWAGATFGTEENIEAFSLSSKKRPLTPCCCGRERVVSKVPTEERVRELLRDYNEQLLFDLRRGSPLSQLAILSRVNSRIIRIEEGVLNKPLIAAAFFATLIETAAFAADMTVKATQH
jgi:hypothetical protein